MVQKSQPIKPYFKPWHRAGAGHTPQQIRVVLFDPNLFPRLHWEHRHLTYLSRVINKSGHRLRKSLETLCLSAFLWFVSLGDQRNEHPLKSLFNKNLKNKLHGIVKIKATIFQLVNFSVPATVFISFQLSKLLTLR